MKNSELKELLNELAKLDLCAGAHLSDHPAILAIHEIERLEMELEKANELEKVFCENKEWPGGIKI